MKEKPNDRQNDLKDEKEIFTIRLSKLVIVVGIIGAAFFSAIIMLFLFIENEGALGIVLSFLPFILLSVFVLVYALKWRIEVDSDSIASYHPFRKPQLRSYNFDEITKAKYGIGGLYIYVGNKRIITIDGFARNQRKLYNRLCELGKVDGYRTKKWVNAKIRWVDEKQGGRKTHVPVNIAYFPIITFPNSVHSGSSWSAEIYFQTQISKNEYVAILSFLFDDAPPELLQEGAVFGLFEGGTFIAEGVILS